MKPKGKPESEIPTAKNKPNKKKTFEARDGDKKFNTSLLRKNEFALIVMGALLLTLLIFFLFFRSSVPVDEPAKNGVSTPAFADLEKRIEKIEQVLKDKGISGHPSDQKEGVESDPLKDRVTRLETAFSVKFDSLIERMGRIEKNIAILKKKPVPTVIAKPTPRVIKPVKKVIKKDQKKSMFHTVKKGETLYSISKKYNTGIAALRKLNNLKTTAKIYPGDNLLIR